MKKQENKKFGFEKFEMAKLTVLKKTKGGTGNVLTGNDDPGTITDVVDAIKSFFCDDKKEIV